MVTDADNVAMMRAIYAQILSNLLEAERLGSDTISVDGVSLNTDAAYAKLERLAKIPGVAPAPVFTQTSVAR